jgi:hypothetical protein
MDETCTNRITMTIADYEHIRAYSSAFAVLPGHNVPDVEDIVREEPGFVVVSKLGAGARVAERLDPRKESLR